MVCLGTHARQRVTHRPQQTQALPEQRELTVTRPPSRPYSYTLAADILSTLRSRGCTTNRACRRVAPAGRALLHPTSAARRSATRHPSRPPGKWNRTSGGGIAEHRHERAQSARKQGRRQPARSKRLLVNKKIQRSLRCRAVHCDTGHNAAAPSPATRHGTRTVLPGATLCLGRAVR